MRMKLPTYSGSDHLNETRKQFEDHLYVYLNQTILYDNSDSHFVDEEIQTQKLTHQSSYPVLKLIQVLVICVYTRGNLSIVNNFSF